MNKRKENWLIITDLDGTLLDEQNYSFSQAEKALLFLKAKKFPVIPCTSKTHQEVIALREQIGLDSPFIVENGSAVFFNSGYFNISFDEYDFYQSYQYITLGKKYEEILKFFRILKSEFNIGVKGFSEMMIPEIQQYTNMTTEDAQKAKERFFSEPFIIVSENPPFNEIQEYARQKGFRVLKGNRFYHLLAASDKGQAIKQLLKLFRLKFPDYTLNTIGIGDSLNDIELLKNVDIPVLVNKPSGCHQPGIEIKNLIKTKLAGPAGWQEAIFQIIQKK
ncbi:MAG: HAD-IIB family hydrolase [Calditrichaceae bacterium]|nr:HAD-IIB family hydrolase [Calditrichaceae bacterium]MBN2708326.1 HAD-IIB family hydrolase [Calditrichaceae bacterium]RQV95215.1 MAG: HAD-IIB family hydrolase [Calditrichota bacterium]